MSYLLIAMLIYLQHEILETGISNEGSEISCSTNPSRFDIRQCTLDDLFKAHLACRPLWDEKTSNNGYLKNLIFKVF